MTETDHPRADLAALALGLLDDSDAQRVRVHLSGCAACRGELVELRDAALLGAALEPADLVADLPDLPERSGAAPGPDGDLLLARTLREIRAERAAARRRSRVSLAAVAAAAVLLGGAGGVGLDLVRGPAEPAPSTPLAQPSGAGTVQLAGVSPSGATADVTVEPVRDWVRLAVRVTGIPAGQRCRVVVVTTEGERVGAGSWTVGEPPPPGTTRPPVRMAAAVPLDEVAAVEVETLAGEPVVSAPA
ncbi:MAG: zf-HC2 domain-containing protein [Kineosporiaceae bacterium]